MGGKKSEELEASDQGSISTLIELFKGPAIRKLKTGSLTSTRKMKEMSRSLSTIKI